MTGAEMRATQPSATRKTARLSLHPPESPDIDFIVDMFSRRDLVAHRPDPRPDTPEESAARLARDMAHWKDHGFGRWAALAGENLVGFGGVTVSKEFEGLNLSYHLHPDYWGHGFATELVTETIRFAFEDVGACRIVGLVRPINPTSRRVLERCGFSFEQEVMLHDSPTHLYALGR
ncbi:GNAT family N-acetyltransferase [Rhizobium sp. R693]|uniref:GNAT family N-acetyltransferase n=1 Tax=Rhizobium sp. R693 TaxID=1764276 RepID=UPI001FD9B2BB|nr:GNAT family N-acetyltransferase [Rhizobium sp. R693]